MYRSAINDLLKWKDSPRRKPLILEGARQVGKTWLLQKFGAEHYRNLLYINFEVDKDAREIFDGSFEPERILSRLSIHAETEIIPGETLIVLDEVQEAPRALTALKYFCEDAPEHHIVVAGSLLGISLHQDISFPVGKVNYLRIHPLTFEEFLIAKGNRKLAEALMTRGFDLIRPFHDSLNEMLRTYLVVGGMPEAVKVFLENKSMLGVREVQRDILRDYERDFSKHSSKFDAPKIQEIFDIMPAVLAKENKKFMFGMIKQSARAREYESALLWLTDAGIATRVPRVNKLALPMAAYADNSAFKLFCVDVGLLGCKANLRPEAIYDERELQEFKGALAEQFVFQELFASEQPTYYYSSDDSRVEVDFLADTEQGLKVLEVKSGKNLSSASLNRIMEQYPDLNAIKLSMLPYEEHGKLVNLPLYAAGTIR